MVTHGTFDLVNICGDFIVLKQPWHIRVYVFKVINDLLIGGEFKLTDGTLVLEDSISDSRCLLVMLVADPTSVFFLRLTTLSPAYAAASPELFLEELVEFLRIASSVLPEFTTGVL